MFNRVLACTGHSSCEIPGARSSVSIVGFLVRTDTRKIRLVDRPAALFISICIAATRLDRLASETPTEERAAICLIVLYRVPQEDR